MKRQPLKHELEVVMTILYRRLGRPVAGTAAATALILGLVALAFQLSSSAKAASTTCNAADTVNNAPTGPATVSVSSTTAFGKVLVVGGSGAFDGCSLYLLTSDELHAMTGSQFACSDGLNAKGLPCDTVLWPALLTDGTPIAGPGVNPKLLGTVTRTDLPGLGTVQQVTYAGLPLYRFNKDEDSGETEGANVFDPLSSPTGIWYLVEPSRGNPAPGTALLQSETAPLGGTDTNQTVLAATMDQDFTPFLPTSGGTFPVYAMGRHEANHAQHGPWNGCFSLCAQYWPPVLTSGQPEAGAAVDQGAVGTITRPDGTKQVTYKGRPLYLFADDAYIPGLPYNGGAASINGMGAQTMWGMFNTIPQSP
jgi:predicted lipoprotein with Yx(FWY)xxD motif